jgi:HEAT repeat protein
MRAPPSAFLLALLAMAPVAPAAEPAAPAAAPAGAVTGNDDELLAAARAVDDIYQSRIARLIDQLADADEQHRLQALSLIGRLYDPALVPYLLPFLQSSKRSPAELIAAASALPPVGSEPATPLLKNLLKHPEPSVRVNAMNALTRLQAIGSDDYKARANDASGAIRGSSDANLGRLAVADAAPILLKAMAFDERPHVRRMCAISLGLLGDKAHAPALTDALADGNPGVRRYAAEALVKLDYKPAIPHLLMALEANVAGDHLNRSLKLLSGQDFGFDSRANPLARTAAIEKGFKWWTENSKELNK